MFRISTFIVGAALGLATIAQANAPTPQHPTAVSLAKVIGGAMGEGSLPGYKSQTVWFDRAMDDVTTGRSVASGFDHRGVRNSL